MTQAPQGGLIAAGSRLIPSKYRFAIGLLLFAAIMMMAKKAGLDIPGGVATFGICLGIAAVIAEMTAAADIVRNWWYGKAGGIIGAFAIWSFAFLFAINNWIGAATENQAEKTDLHKTKFVTAQTVKADYDSKKKDHDRLQQRASWMEVAINGQPVRTVEAAQADIDNAMSHRFWKVTGECKETKGPQTREFCSKYRSALTEKDLAVEKATLILSMEAAKDEMDAAKTALMTTKTVTSEARSDLTVLTDYVGMSEKGAETFNGVFGIAALSILLSFFMARQELDTLKSEGPRRKFNWISKLYRWAYRVLNGEEAVVPGQNTHTIERVIDDRAAVDQIKRMLAQAIRNPHPA